MNENVSNQTAAKKDDSQVIKAGNELSEGTGVQSAPCEEGENSRAPDDGGTEEYRGFSALKFADTEPWMEEVDGAALLEEMQQTLKRFAVLPPWSAETLALWTLHTYAFELRNVTTYVGISSPEKRCGKTTVLTVLSEMVNRPVVAANISPSAFFRVIEEGRPTLLIDEADTFLQGNEELRGILNSGYTRKTAYVVRVSGTGAELRTRCARRPAEAATKNRELNKLNGRKENGRRHSRLARYSCWCPKVMAAIGRLPETLADRCIVITMQRKAAEELCERLRHLDATELRMKCSRFVRDHGSAIANARPAIPPTLNDRAGDIWEPLLVLADLAGGEWPKIAREAAVSLSASAQENNPIGSLLLDILIIFVSTGAKRMFSRALVAGLNGFAERPWKEMKKGKEIDELWLSQKLRPYGVRPKTMWIDGHAAKGYLEEDFKEVFPRYVPRSEVEALKASAREAEMERRKQEEGEAKVIS